MPERAPGHSPPLPRMDSRLFSHDPLTGITTTFHYDDVTETVTLETTQPVDHLAAVNHAEYLAHSDHSPTRWKGDWHKVASIPLVEMHRLQREGKIDREGIVQDDKALIKILNDRDYLKWRTMPGRL